MKKTLAGVALLIPVSGCDLPPDGLFAAAGPVAEAQSWHFLFIVGCVAVVILPLFVALPVVLWRYHYGRNRGDYRPNWNFSAVLEVVIWLIPVVVVVVMADVLWREAHDLDPYAPIEAPGTPLEVRVVTLDWKFLFLYPETGVATVNRLVLPAKRPVRFELTSATVMQSFHIPRLGGQIYTMGGMVTELNLMAETPGLYRGQNTQYNGRGFPDQKFAVEALPPTAFRDWLAKAEEEDRLDNDAWQRLIEPSVVEPETYGSYNSDLFDAVVRWSLDPAQPLGDING